MTNTQFFLPKNNELKSMKTELQYAIDDINNNPAHVVNYDLYSMCKELYIKGINATLSELLAFLSANKNTFEVLTEFNKIKY